MIVACGEALIDFIPVAYGTENAYLPKPGGSPFNTAITTARLGAPTGFLSRVSTDLFGDQICQALSSDSVSLELVTRVANPSTLAFVDLAGEEPQYAFFTREAADRTIEPADVANLPGSVSCLHLGLGADTLETQPFAGTYLGLFERMKGLALRSFDPNIRANMISDRAHYAGLVEQALSRFDLVKVSAADLEWLFGGESEEQIVQRWLALGPAMVVVTRGSRGAAAWRSGKPTVEVAARPIKVVDTVGAGDSFTGALLVSLGTHTAHSAAALTALGEGELRSCLEHAVRVAAITCSRAGANPPYAEEV
jgi:fructokinase